jgi:hypothetical protein
MGEKISLMSTETDYTSRLIDCKQNTTIPGHFASASFSRAFCYQPSSSAVFAVRCFFVMRRFSDTPRAFEAAARRCVFSLPCLLPIFSLTMPNNREMALPEYT